jgi:hypothetical protein
MVLYQALTRVVADPHTSHKLISDGLVPILNVDVNAGQNLGISIPRGR